MDNLKKNVFEIINLSAVILFPYQLQTFLHNRLHQPRKPAGYISFGLSKLHTPY